MTFSKLGTDIDTGQFVYLPKAARLQGLYIIGIQGTGKSGLIENLIMQDIDQQIGVCVLDPHGELIDHVIARLPGKAEEEKVIYLDLTNYSYPFGLNLFECPNTTDDGEIVKTLSQVLHVFEKAYGIVPTTPLMYDLLYNTAYTLIANPGYTLIDIRLLLTNEACRKKLVANVPNPDVQDFWTVWDDPKQTTSREQEERRGTILNKLNDFSHVPLRNIVGQSTSTIDLQKIMDEGKILLVKLSRRLEQPSNLIGSIIISQLLNAAYARPTNKRKQFHLYADEFQNFATEDFATLLEEARKFGIGTTIAHQNRGQLNSANSKLETDLKDRSRSVGNMVVFKINSKDADDIAGEFNIAPPATETKSEAVRTPIMEPIQHMLTRGVHPLPWMQKFINVYGQELVQGAKQEEELERDYRHALNSYQMNVAIPRLTAMILEPPKSFYRNALEQLNRLFYQTMIAGKQGNDPDSIPLSQELLFACIYAFRSVPLKVRHFLDSQQAYNNSVAQLNVFVTDWNTREREIQNRLAFIKLSQSSPRQHELNVARASYINAVKNLRSVLRRTIIARVEEVTKRCVIVRKGRRYYRPVFNLHYFLDSQDLYKLDFGSVNESEDLDFQELHLYHIESIGGYRFRSLDEALVFYAQALRFLWFRVEPTIRDKNWWQHQRSVVNCSNWKKNPSNVPATCFREELDMWVLKSGIERTWYTNAMLENMVETYLKAVVDLNRDRFRSCAEFLPESIAGEDYRELTGWTSPSMYGIFKEQKTAGQKEYDARQEFTKLQEEIANEVRQEQASLKSELRLLAELQKYKPDYDKFVGDFTHQLRMVMRELATPKGRIEDVSGIWEEQPIAPRTYADVQNEIANSLVGLPNFTARVKIGTNNGTVEHTVKTLPPGQGIGKAVFDRRIATIQTRNRDPRYGGYTRPRQDVEAENLQRQTSCSGSAPAQLQQPQQPSPRRVARQVPIQVNCPNCGASNQSGSNFCNQCGTKLT